MEPRRTTREQAHEWLLNHLERVEQDPDVLATMPLDDVLEMLPEAADPEAIQRIKTRFAPLSTSVGPQRADRPARPLAHRRRWAWPVAATLAVLLVTAGVLWGIGPASLSEAERLVTLDAYEAEIVREVGQPATLKAVGTGWAEVEAGWAALRQARRQPLGFPFGYDDEAARLGAEHLEAAYRLGKTAGDDRIDEKGQVTESLPPQGLVAFLIAQAYLMLEDADRARFWLQTATGYDEEPWRSAAEALLSQLPPSSS